MKPIVSFNMNNEKEANALKDMFGIDNIKNIADSCVDEDSTDETLKQQAQDSLAKQIFG